MSARSSRIQDVQNNAEGEELQSDIVQAKKIAFKQILKRKQKNQIADGGNETKSVKKQKRKNEKSESAA